MYRVAILAGLLLTSACGDDAPASKSGAPVTAAPNVPAASSPTAPAPAKQTARVDATPSVPEAAAPGALVTPTPSAPVMPTPSVPVGEYKVSTEGAQSITIGGVVIETAADLPQREASASTSVMGNNQVAVTLRGWQVVVHDGRVLVGGQDFGLAPSGSHVRLSKDGVRVGEELRGPLP